MTPSARSGTRTVFIAGLTAGTLDLTAACLSSWLRAGVPPVRVMQSVASGLLGADAYTGGATAALLGVVAHFFIATVVATVFYVASRRLTFLVDHYIVAGLLYGAGVYIVMNFVVLPLSAFRGRAAPTLSGRAIGMFIIMVCIGLPIAAIVRRSSKPL